jgi:hypothetical protein
VDVPTTARHTSRGSQLSLPAAYRQRSFSAELDDQVHKWVCEVVVRQHHENFYTDWYYFRLIVVVEVLSLDASQSNATASQLGEEPMLYCPVCSERLAESRCKLICKKCGYFMSCSDYY